MTSGVQVVCPTCGAFTAMRISRAGMLQRVLMPRLGFYPWKCGSCGCTFLCRNRGHEGHDRRRSRGHAH